MITNSLLAWTKIIQSEIGLQGKILRSLNGQFTIWLAFLLFKLWTDKHSSIPRRCLNLDPLKIKIIKALST